MRATIQKRLVELERISAAQRQVGALEPGESIGYSIRDALRAKGFIQGANESIAEMWARACGITMPEFKEQLSARAFGHSRREEGSLA